MPDRAVIRLQPGPTPVDKQRLACIGYVASARYALAGIIPAAGDARDAIRMVARGDAEVVVVAYGGRDLAALVAAAGGRVEAVHPKPHVVEPPVPPPATPRSSAALLARLRARGKTIREIADFTELPTGEIRRMLRRGE